MTEAEAVDKSLRKLNRIGTIAGVVGGILGTLVAFAGIVAFVFNVGMRPFAAKIETETKARVESDKVIVNGLGKVAQMVVSDSSAQAVLLQQVKELKIEEPEVEGK